MDTEEAGVALVEKITANPDINNNFKDIELEKSYTAVINTQKTVFYEIQAKKKK